MREDCVHYVPSGTAATIVDGAFVVSMPQTDAEVSLPKCVGSVDVPILLPAVRSSAHQRRLQLPPNYDGWPTYAAVNDSYGFDTMTGYMSTPNVPAAKPDVLYLFPGLQDIDWIPAVDPEPAADFDIIQPVIEYPDQQTGNGWSVRSWWVTLHHGAMSSSEIPLTVGASVFGNMTKINSAGDWYIGSTLTNGRTTSLVARAATVGTRLQHQRWAYVTTECYGCTGCTTFPTNSEIFSQLRLTVNGSAVSMPQWIANPKPDKRVLCHEATAIVNSSTIVMTYQTA